MTTTMQTPKLNLNKHKHDYIDEMIYRITNSIIADNFYGGSYQREFLTKIKYDFYKKDTTEFFNDYKNIILNDMKDYDIESIKKFILNDDSGYYYDLNCNEYDDYDKFETYLNTLSDDDIRVLMNKRIEIAFFVLEINTLESRLEELKLYMTEEEIEEHVTI
jgi:hypothetical protein